MFEKPNFQFCNRALYAQYVCGYFRTIDSLDFMFVFALKEIKNLMLIQHIDYQDIVIRPT